MTLKFKRLEPGLYFSEDGRFLIEKSEWSNGYNDWLLTDLERWSKPGGFASDRSAAPVLRNIARDTLADAKAHAEFFLTWEENAYCTPEAARTAIREYHDEARRKRLEWRRIEEKRESGEWLKEITPETTGEEWLDADPWERYNAVKRADGKGFGSVLDEEYHEVISAVAFGDDVTEEDIEEAIDKVNVFIDRLSDFKSISVQALGELRRRNGNYTKRSGGNL